MKVPKSNLWLAFFVVACMVGPALTQLAIAYIPSAPKGTFSRFLAKGQEPFFSVVSHRDYEISYEPEITVAGRILPPQVAKSVRLEINETPLDTAPGRDEEGHFWARIPFGDYENTIVAHAPFGSRIATHVFHLPRDDPYQPPTVPRELALTLSPQQAAVTFTVTYSGTRVHNLDLVDLQADRIGADLFVKRVFYPANSPFSGEEFSTLAARPTFAVAKDQISVTVAGTLSAKEYVPDNILHILGVTLQPKSASAPPTTISLQFDGVQPISAPYPWPDSWRGNVVEWVDPAEQIQLEYELLTEFPSGLAWLRGLWREIQAAMDRMEWAPGAVALLVGPAIPFLWILHLLRHQSMNDGSIRGKRKLLIKLALLMWLVPVLAFLVPFALILHTAATAVGLSDAWLPWFRPELSLWASSASYCMLLPLAYRLNTQQSQAGESRQLKWLGIILASILLNVCVLVLEGYVSVLLFPVACVVLCCWAWLVCELYRPGQSTLRKAFRSWPVGIGLAVVLVLLALPFSEALPSFSIKRGWGPHPWAQFYFAFGPLLLPFTVLAGLAPTLKASRSDLISPDRARSSRSTARFLFATFALGSLGTGLGSSQWFILRLIPFLLAAFWVYPYLVEGGIDESKRRAAGARAELDLRPRQITELRQAQWEAKEKAKQEAAAKKDKEEAREKTGDTRDRLPRDYDVRRAIFGFGPVKRPWENGRLSCLYGLILSAGLFVVYVPFLFAQTEALPEASFPILKVLGSLVLPFFAKWLLAAFVLGYYFPNIRGANGLQKGLVLAMGILACTLPGNLLLSGGSESSLLTLVWDAGQAILFLTILGFWAFDLNTVKRYGMGWRGLLEEYGLSFLAPYLSSVGGAVGLAITGVVTGKAESIVGSLLETQMDVTPSGLEIILKALYDLWQGTT